MTLEDAPAEPFLHNSERNDFRLSKTTTRLKFKDASAPGTTQASKPCETRPGVDAIDKWSRPAVALAAKLIRRDPTSAYECRSKVGSMGSCAVVRLNEVSQ
jgi:hypothetical protein